MSLSAAASSDLEGLAARLEARGALLGSPLYLLDEATSTNDLAKAGARAGAPHGALWIAERQTAGRGRQGRAWHSPSGEGIWASLLLRLACPPARLPPLSLVTGLAVCDAIAPATREPPALKWPNDVLLGGKKVAGCLVEAQLAGARLEALIVGVGINVHTRVFPDDLAARATSVTLHAREASTPNRAEIVIALLAALARDLPLAVERGLAPLAARIAAVDALRGRYVSEAPPLGEGAAAETPPKQRGLAEGIDDEGRLLVRRATGEIVRLGAGEVHLAPPML